MIYHQFQQFKQQIYNVWQLTNVTSVMSIKSSISCGVIQKPGTDFTVSGSTLTFTTAPAANTSFFAILLGSDNGETAYRLMVL